MTGAASAPDGVLPPAQQLLAVEQLCDRFEDHRRAGTPIGIAELLAEAPEPIRPVVFRELLLLDLEFRPRGDRTSAREEYLAGFPQYAGIIDTVLLAAERGGLDSITPPPAQPSVTIPHDPGPLSTTRTADQPVRASIPPPSFDNRYIPGELIAHGGMGAVFRAVDTVLDRVVAIKVLLPQLAGTNAADRFHDEARVAGRLQHPSIPPVHDLGVLADGRPFMAMKLIDGRTLAKLLAARQNVAVNLDDLALVYEQICQAVAYAHSVGVIHRDLKPGNIVVGAFGEVQVMDWGVAKVLRPAVAERGGGTDPLQFMADPPDDRTREGAALGTPAYMPPEQARGELDRVNERSDVFALGGILCEILTGRPPYTGGGDILGRAIVGDLTEAHHRLGRAVGVTLATRRLQLVALKCLAADPDERYENAAEVAAAVHALRAKGDEIKRRQAVNEAVDQERSRRVWGLRQAWTYLICGVVVALLIAVAARYLITEVGNKTKDEIQYRPTKEDLEFWRQRQREEERQGATLREKEQGKYHPLPTRGP